MNHIQRTGPWHAHVRSQSWSSWLNIHHYLLMELPNDVILSQNTCLFLQAVDIITVWRVTEMIHAALTWCTRWFKPSEKSFMETFCRRLKDKHPKDRIYKSQFKLKLFKTRQYNGKKIHSDVMQSSLIEDTNWVNVMAAPDMPSVMKLTRQCLSLGASIILPSDPNH